MIRGNIDILLIAENKTDTSSPSTQFQIDGYTAPYCLYRNANGRRMLLYARNDIACKVLGNTDFGGEIEAMFVQFTVKKLIGL